MIGSWEAYWDHQMEYMPDRGLYRWVPDEELRPLMVGKFRRIHAHAMRRATRRLWNADIEDTRRTAYVVRRKYLARRKRKH